MATAAAVPPADDPEGLVTFEADGVKYTALFGNRARKAAETHYDLPFFRILQKVMPNLDPADVGDPAKVAAASMDVRFSDISNLFEFALLKFHRDLTEDDIDDLIDTLGIERTSAIVGQAVAAGMAREGDAGFPENPRRKPSRKRPTGLA